MKLRNLIFWSAVALIAGRAAAGTVSITTAADSGSGSLRQAILDANSGACAQPCSITYGTTGGVLTIAPLTPLPDITAPRTSIVAKVPFQAWTLEISGSNLTSGSGLHIRAANCSVLGVIVNGFPGSGIVLEDASGSSLSYDIIGLDASGTRAVPNRQNGVTIVRGGRITLESNTIGGNAGNGVYVIGASEVFFGLNTIGKQYLPQGSGDRVLPNGASGVFLQDVQGAQFLGNTIANNTLDGIAVAGASSGILIEGIDLPTLIYGNGILPIDIGFDGVTDQGRPLLTTADLSNGFVRVIGQVTTTANATVIVNVFASDSIHALGISDAKISLYAAKVQAGPNGVAAFEFHVREPSDLTGQWISATATTDATSELSAPLRIVENDQNYNVTNTNDSGAGSLRQAILDADAGICAADFPCRVQFDLPTAGGHSTIMPLTPLPPITRSGIIVDGVNTAVLLPYFPAKAPVVEINGSRSTPGAGLTISSANGPLVNDSIRHLAINGFNGPGILIDASSNSILNPTIAQNFIGTDASGTIAVPNSGDGIRVRGNVPFVHFGTYGSGNRIEGNLISGNGGNGVKLESGFFEFEANSIGTDFTRKLPIPNGGAGVDIEGPAQGHLEGNTIAFNRGTGLSIVATAPQAFKASIQNAIHSNVGPAITDDPVVQAPPEITSATFDAPTQTGTITGSFTRAATSGGWTTWLDFYASAFPESDGRGSGETPIFTQFTLGDAGGSPTSFTVTTRGVDLGGKRVSATATPFIFQGFKGPPQNDVFGQGFEYGTTSTMSRGVPVVTAECSALEAQLVAPFGDPGEGLVEFRWNPAAGATSYNIWLRPIPGAPKVIATTSGTNTLVPLQAGVYDWFVEAAFPQCPSTKSEAARITVLRGRQRVVGH